MIALASTSFCDICHEGFGQTPGKVPCSLRCGHVFCYVCLTQVDSKLCPLCRVPYEDSSIVKLHLDLDGSPTGTPISATQAEQEARKFQDLIAHVANHGSSEKDVRVLIDDCRRFLTSQPRSMFPELRITHRMMSYMCDIRASLMAQEQATKALQSQINQLSAEKEEVERRIQEVKISRKNERRTALAVERSLRDHCSRAHEAYETIVDQYNFVVQEWMRLQQEVKLLRLPPTPQPVPPTPDLDLDPDLAKTPQPRFITELNQTKLKSAAVQDPASFMISPLPQFTGRLPEAIALPDEDEPQEKLKAKKTTPARQEQSQLAFQSLGIPPSPSLTKCDAAGHPYTCNCEEFSIFNDEANKRASRRPSITSTASTPILEAKAKSSSSTPPGVAPVVLMSPGRMRSHTIPTQSSRPTSRAPSPNPQPSVYSSPVPSQSSLRSRETGESLTSRLHDLLQDNTGVSSSLPNMSSSHFPASLTRGTPRQIPEADLPLRPPSRSETTPPQYQVPSTPSHEQGDNGRVRVSPPMATSYVAPSTPSTPAVPTPPPAPVFSRASNAAMAMEKERKEKKEQERERRRLEKEKKRLTEHESLGRSNSISSTTSASTVSSASHPRSHLHSGRESTVPYVSQRHTSASSSHAPTPVATPGIYI